MSDQDNDLKCINCGFTINKTNLMRHTDTENYCAGSRISAIRGSITRSKYYHGRCSICGRVVQLDRYGVLTNRHSPVANPKKMWRKNFEVLNYVTPKALR